MPADTDIKALQSLDDAIYAVLQNVCGCQFVAIGMSGGARDLFFYVNNADKAGTALEKMTKSGKYREFGAILKSDPEWRSVQHFLNMK